MGGSIPQISECPEIRSTLCSKPALCFCIPCHTSVAKRRQVSEAKFFPHLSFIEFKKQSSCKMNISNPKILPRLSTRKPSFRSKSIVFASKNPNPNLQESISISSSTSQPKTRTCTVNFRTLGACKLGISRYPDFEYNAQGGKGTGTGSEIEHGDSNDEVSVSFDPKTLYIPPLSSRTTKFLGLPLPPLLKIDIVPELFQGSIDQATGKVDLEFVAAFLFSVESIYRAPPLLVKTVLTSEESEGTIRRGAGKRLDEEGNCRLVGVATVEPINDIFMNTFLGLPTECLAILNAVISFSSS